MTKQAIIERTIQVIAQLPVAKAEEISAFADFLSKRHEEEQLTAGIGLLAVKSQTFDFLATEENLYSVADLQEVYGG